MGHPSAITKTGLSLQVLSHARVPPSNINRYTVRKINPIFRVQTLSKGTAIVPFFFEA